MVQYHKQPKTKASGTGGKKRALRGKLLAHFGGFFSRTHFKKEADKEVRETRRTKGGSAKQAGKIVLFANVSGQGAAAGKVSKARILDVKESPDNPHHSRENIVTRGAIIETDLGKAAVTSRPGQSGMVSAVLLEERKQATPSTATPKTAKAEPKPVAATA